MPKKILDYTPPKTSDLAQLKTRLGYTSEQMADFLGVAGGNQWRKYTSGKSRRTMGVHYLFFLAARITLAPDEFARVLDTMRDLGGDFSFSDKNVPCP